MESFATIDEVLPSIKTKIDADTSDKTKVLILFALNASGKTRLSKLFADQYDEQVIYYNAFTEDLFSWDNESYILKIDNRVWIFRFIQEQGLDGKILENFQKFTGSKLEPKFNIPEGQITFNRYTGENDNPENIKISRGEESAFIWSIFYTVLDIAVDTLNEAPEIRSTNAFDSLEYIVIDDPVSSMDDTRIITVALDLAELISKSNNKIKFLITTHHALFFNVLFTSRIKNCNKKNYILSKSETEIQLKVQGNESPFAYHHLVIAEIEQAIQKDDIRKYHFNLFRTLLEKTANFLGYGHWKICLQSDEHGKTLIKLIDQYSHNRLADLEPRDLPTAEKEEFKEAFRFFMKDLKWGMSAND